MTKTRMLSAAAALLFSLSGQAMACFTTGDLIQVVYKVNGAGNEVITDLGRAGNWTKASKVPTAAYDANPVSLGQFPGSSWSDLQVAYFIYSGCGNFWVSGPTDGQSNNAGEKKALKVAILKVMKRAASAAHYGTQAIIPSSKLHSYWKLLDLNGTDIGGFADFANGGTANEANLANLATGGSVDLYLYYYPSATSGRAGTGVRVAKLSIFPDGTTEATASPQLTPVPAPILLLGSGLLGLIRIRRKQAA